MSAHPEELLGAYADGELPPDEARRVEAHLQRCTECARELAQIRFLGGAMRSLQPRSTQRSVWEGVHRRITRPVGWILLLAGLVLWLGLALLAWLREELTLEWLAITAMGVGLVLIAVGIGYEQYREWKESPYRDVER